MITIPSGNSRAFVDAVRPQSTGLISGGILSRNAVDPTKFDLTAGIGIIVDNRTTPLRPTHLVVTWDSMTSQDDPHLTETETTYIAIDHLGNLVFSTDEFSDIQRRSLIVIGWNDHQDMTEIFVSQTEPFYACGALEQFSDFVEAFGAFNIEGNVYTASSGMTIQRSAGKVFDGNSNYFNDKRDPHVITSNLENPVDVTYYYRDGAGGWVNDNDTVSVVDPNHWDNNILPLASVPLGKFTIQLISYYAPYDASDIQLGQAVYDTMAAAESALRDAIEIDPYNSFDVVRTWLIVKQGTTDLTNAAHAKFIPAGKLGIMDVASGGGAGGEVNTASNVGTTGVGLYYAKVGVDLQFKNLKSSTGKITITDSPLDFTVDLGVSLVAGDVGLGNVPNVDATDPANIDQDTTHRFATDAEKSAWNAKVDQVAGMGLSHNDLTDVLKSGYDAAVVASHSHSNKSALDLVTGTNTGDETQSSIVTKIGYTPLAPGAVAAFFTPANPANITLATFRMFGLGSTIKMTPLKTGKVRFTINYFPGGVGTAGTNSYKICYGTGTAPANGVAASGTVVGRTDAGGTAIQVAGTPAAIVRDVIITGLVVGTAYWFDVQGARNSGNSACSMGSIEATLEELPY